MSTRQSKPCSRLRWRWAERLGWSSLAVDGFLAGHVRQCPRCRRRLAGYGRTAWGLLLLRTQSHREDLLGRANDRVLRMLRRDTRAGAQADALRRARLLPSWRARLNGWVQGLGQAAACLLVVVGLRLGVFDSLMRVEQQGQDTLRGYYARNLGDEAATDLLGEPTDGDGRVG